MSECKEPADEAFCRDALIDNLRKSGANVSSRRGDDPPDYDFDIDGIAFGVEVTQAVQQIPRTGRSFLSEIGLNAMATDLTRKIETVALDQSILKGTYVLDFFDSSCQFEQSKRHIISMCICEIKSTQHLSEFARRILVTPDGYAVGLCKFRSSKNSLYEVISNSDTGSWESEVVDEFRQVITQAIARKASNEKMVNCGKPIILAVLDRYYLAWAGGVIDLALAGMDISPFHSVYVVTNDQVAHKIP